MDRAQSDLVVWYKLETEFFQDHVRHTRYLEKAKNRNEKVEEDWSNCGELGRGGFGVVHKQIRKATGHYRAVKTIDKRLSIELDYSRELLVMAILTKHPPLFVEFLGWFEEPETLYIAMEYFKEGDLSKHTGTPLPQEIVQDISKQIFEGLKVMHQQGIAHRDLKPANIFVVSMSPVWVKLGDFGVSKRIRAHGTTTFHTQVSTPVYGAPEVLGLDSNSETSDYTNSVDIWSLGCVIYELLAGTKLFVSEFHVSCYLFGKWLFPEGMLRGLSPPTDEIGISLLKSMLVIQPEDRPTAAGALRHPWLAGLESHEEYGRDDERETVPICNLRERGDLITEGDIDCFLGDCAQRANSGSAGGDSSAIPEATVDASVMTPTDAASAEISTVQTRPQNFEQPLRYHFAPHFKRLNAVGKKQIYDIPPTCPENPQRAISQRLVPTKEIVSNQLHGQMSPRNSLHRTCGRSRPITAAGGMAETKMAQPSINYKSLTAGKTRILAAILIGFLMLAGILTKIPKLALILTGILMLAGMLAGIPTLSRTFARISMPATTLTSEEIEISDRTEWQSRTELNG